MTTAQPVPSPIGTCELQGYWFAAQQLMALLAGYGRSATTLARHCEAPQSSRNGSIATGGDDQQFYALALDPEKRQVRAVTSNVGHCLACGIIEREHLPRVVGRHVRAGHVQRLGHPDAVVRYHAFYNPLSYHRGTVWAVEQATIAFGLRRFGFDARALDLAQALFDLAELYPEYRIPECIGGYARGERPVPGAYPRANTPQLWNASAFPLDRADDARAAADRARPERWSSTRCLPRGCRNCVLRDLRVGGAKATLRFWRDEPVSRSGRSCTTGHAARRSDSRRPNRCRPRGAIGRRRTRVHSEVDGQ